MDDIDDLLNDAETLCIKDYNKVTSKNNKSKKVIDDQVSSLLDEIDSLEANDDHIEKISSAAGVRGDKTVRQCSPGPLLGGVVTSTGVSSVSSPRSCDRLLCLQCNIPVISIDHVEWDQSTDYLFLRNNVPNIDKLRGNILTC